MSRTAAWTLNATVMVMAVTGGFLTWIVFFAPDPVETELEMFAAQDPWQPWLATVHIVIAPLLLFAMGLIWYTHVWGRIKLGYDHRRRVGRRIQCNPGPNSDKMHGVIPKSLPQHLRVGAAPCKPVCALRQRPRLNSRHHARRANPSILHIPIVLPPHQHIVSIGARLDPPQHLFTITIKLKRCDQISGRRKIHKQPYLLHAAATTSHKGLPQLQVPAQFCCTATGSVQFPFLPGPQDLMSRGSL